MGQRQSVNGNSKQESEKFQLNLENALDEVARDESHYETYAKITVFTEKEIRLLHRIFVTISASELDDGFIDDVEFARALGMPVNSLLARRLFQEFNVTQTDRMNFREFCMALSLLSDKASIDDKIKFSFDLYDLNKDGKIDESELLSLVEAAFSDSGASVPKETIEMICRATLSETDVDNNGTIEHNEYEFLIKQNPRLMAPFTIFFSELVQRYHVVSSPSHSPRNLLKLKQQRQKHDDNSRRSSGSSRFNLFNLFARKTRVERVDNLESLSDISRGMPRTPSPKNSGQLKY
eukprot:251542_1